MVKFRVYHKTNFPSYLKCCLLSAFYGRMSKTPGSFKDSELRWTLDIAVLDIITIAYQSPAVSLSRVCSSEHVLSIIQSRIENTISIIIKFFNRMLSLKSNRFNMLQIILIIYQINDLFSSNNSGNKYHGFHKIFSSTTLIIIRNFFKHQISILEWFLKDHEDWNNDNVIAGINYILKYI